MLGRTGWDAAGRVGFDPAARRRVRRTTARARPLLLPLTAVLAAAVVVSAQAPAAAPAPSSAVAPHVPEGMALVVVQPADPGVLPLAVPGSRVDVYAAAGPGVLDPLAETGPPDAERVVSDALVVPPPASAGSPVRGGEPSGPLAAAGGASAGSAAGVTLLVGHDEAAALAARPGGALLVAVRGTAAPTGPGDGAAPGG